MATRVKSAIFSLHNLNIDSIAKVEVDGGYPDGAINALHHDIKLTHGNAIKSPVFF